MSCKLVWDPIPKSQHRPIGIQFQAVVQPETTPLWRHFNFKKAHWQGFTTDLALSSGDVEPAPTINLCRVWASSKRHILWGCCTEYVPGLSPDSAVIYSSYKEKYEADPFSADTIATREALTAAITYDRCKSLKSYCVYRKRCSCFTSPLHQQVQLPGAK